MTALPTPPPLGGIQPIVQVQSGAGVPTPYMQRLWAQLIAYIQASVAALLVPANPTGVIAGPVVDGVLTTYMRSDAAPPLSLTGVTAGSYMFGSGGLTVDQWGRITQIIAENVLTDALGPVVDALGFILVP